MALFSEVGNSYFYTTPGENAVRFLILYYRNIYVTSGMCVFASRLSKSLLRLKPQADLPRAYHRQIL